MATIDSGDLRELTLVRVSGFYNEWFEENDPPRPEPLGRTVSYKRLGKVAQEMWDAGCRTIVITELPDDPD